MAAELMLIQQQLAAERRKREELERQLAEHQRARDGWEAEDVGHDANGSEISEYPEDFPI